MCLDREVGTTRSRHVVNIGKNEEDNMRVRRHKRFGLLTFFPHQFPNFFSHHFGEKNIS